MIMMGREAADMTGRGAHPVDSEGADMAVWREAGRRRR